MEADCCRIGTVFGLACLISMSCWHLIVLGEIDAKVRQEACRMTVMANLLPAEDLS